MSSEGIQVEKKRGRPRKEETRQRRKKRNDLETVGKRLAVNKSSLDFDRFSYRWINDDPARIFTMTQQDDWEVLTPEGESVKEDQIDLGAAVSVIVSRDPNTGQARRAYLCRKPKAWYEEDQTEKQTELDEQLEQLRRGLTKDGEAQSDYVPSGGVKIA